MYKYVWRKLVSCITSERALAVVQVDKTRGTDTSAYRFKDHRHWCRYIYICVRPSGRGQNLDRCQVEHPAVHSIQGRMVFRECACAEWVRLYVWRKRTEGSRKVYGGERTEREARERNEGRGGERNGEG